MRTALELKELLTQSKRNNYELPNTVDINNITDEMLHYIGHTNPELRDHLIYLSFYEWSTRKIISPEKMRFILSVCIDGGHLFCRIGEVDTDAVFTRAFSVLLIPLTFMMDRETPFLTESEVMDTKEAVLRYAQQEKDFRSYVDGKGWAHAAAHAADALDDIAKHKFIGSNGLHEILNAVSLMASNESSVYGCEEDERLVTVFMSVYERKLLPDAAICEWFDHFKSTEKKSGELGDYYRHVNKKLFLRSLYFRLLPLKTADVLFLRGLAAETLAKI